MGSSGINCEITNGDDGTKDSSADQSGSDAGLKERQSERLIQIIEDRGGFDKLEDGFVYYFGGSGALDSWALRVIADELDRRNEPHRKSIEDFFNRTFKGKKSC